MQVAMQVASDSLGYFKKDSADLRTPYPLIQKFRTRGCYGDTLCFNVKQSEQGFKSL